MIPSCYSIVRYICQFPLTLFTCLPNTCICEFVKTPDFPFYIFKSMWLIINVNSFFYSCNGFCNHKKINLTRRFSILLCRCNMLINVEKFNLQLYRNSDFQGFSKYIVMLFQQFVVSRCFISQRRITLTIGIFGFSSVQFRQCSVILSPYFTILYLCYF